ncbi:MAG: tRNA preQ1(34) S-adenosylmethionine ribosyltransferase-isomerase QueA [Campylobacterales bacterium]
MLEYHLPSELIANSPANPRDSSRLLVYSRATKSISHDRFYNLQNYLPENLSIIFNSTKVIKARLYGLKETGGKLELLYEKQGDRGYIFQIGGRVKEGSRIVFEGGYEGRVVKLLEDGFREVAISRDGKNLELDELFMFFEKHGHTPLPPYIKREDNIEDSSDYQSVFASQEGSVAAPTASLHFSKEMFERFWSEYSCAFVTLHVGSGTFKPLSSEDIYAHKMHSEVYEITPEAMNLIEEDKKLMCVGSTALRTVEEYARSGKKSGETSIYITPKNPPKRTDILLTNFHLPKTSLLVMVAAMIGEGELKRVYEEAVKKKYRFFSYGDAMLIL